MLVSLKDHGDVKLVIANNSPLHATKINERSQKEWESLSLEVKQRIDDVVAISERLVKPPRKPGSSSDQLREISEVKSDAEAATHSAIDLGTPSTPLGSSSPAVPPSASGQAILPLPVHQEPSSGKLDIRNISLFDV